MVCNEKNSEEKQISRYKKHSFKNCPLAYIAVGQFFT